MIMQQVCLSCSKGKSRSFLIGSDCARLQKKEAQLLQQVSEGKESTEVSNAIIPTAQHILDHDSNLAIVDKNKLWKIVLRKVTAYRTPEGALRIPVYPNIPHD